MCLAQRSFVYGVMVGLLCCVAGPAGAQQAPQAADPFGGQSPAKRRANAAAHAVESATSVRLATPTAETPTAKPNSSAGVPIIAFAKIRKSLQQPVAVEFNDAPLSEVVGFLVDALAIPIIIDKRALDDVGLGSDTPVTKSLKGVSLRSTLRIILRDLDLTYVVRDEVLKITTPEEAEDALDTRLYAVSNLAYEGPPPMVVTGPVSRFDLLSRVIRSMVEPDTWAEVGGAGSFMPHDPGGFVAIAQTSQLHEKIEALLATIARARKADAKNPEAAAAFAVLRDSDVDARARIEQALQLEATLEFNDAPLSEMVDFVSDQFGIPIIIDHRALDDVGLGADTPVTVSLSGITLRSALRLMLKELDLTSMIADEVLTITTPEEAENELLICVYPMQDLVDTTGSSSESIASIIDMIHASIAPDSWDVVGGAGDVLSAEPWGVLIVSQTDEVHNQIRGLLTAVRRVRTPVAAKPSRVRKRGTSPTASDNPFAAATLGSGGGSSVAEPASPQPALLLKVYALSDAGLVEQVSRMITGTVQGAAWNQSATIFPVGNKLLIRQTQAAHAQIQELLSSIGVAQNVGMGGMGGGMGGPGGGGFF